MRFLLAVATVTMLALGCGGADDNESKDALVAEVGTAGDSMSLEVLDPDDDAVTSGDVNEPEDASSELLAFGAACTGDHECPDKVCHEFGNGGSLCTSPCEEASDCPVGSDGQKCNNKGVCKP